MFGRLGRGGGGGGGGGRDGETVFDRLSGMGSGGGGGTSSWHKITVSQCACSHTSYMQVHLPIAYNKMICQFFFELPEMLSLSFLMCAGCWRR